MCKGDGGGGVARERFGSETERTEENISTQSGRTNPNANAGVRGGAEPEEVGGRTADSVPPIVSAVVLGLPRPPLIPRPRPLFPTGFHAYESV